MAPGDAADLLLRLVAGLAMLPHGWNKLRAWRTQPSPQELAMFERYGLTPAVRWIVGVGAVQVTTGTLLTVGVLVWQAALAQALMMLALVARWPGARAWYSHKGGIEYPLWLGAVSAAVCLSALERS